MFWFQDDLDDMYDDTAYEHDIEEKDEECLDTGACYFDVEVQYRSINIGTGRVYRF